MISKNSFLVSIKQNLKRRNWTLAIGFLFFFFAYPVATLLTIINEKEFYQGSIDMVERMKEVCYDLYMYSEGVLLCMLVGAVILAIQGFSYLYSRKKVDMYHSVPVEGYRRFATIYINGILIFLICYLPNLLLGMAMVFGNGYGDKVFLTGILWSVLRNLLYFLAVYHVTMVAVMLTGNVIVSLLGTGVFLLYECAFRFLLISFKGMYFQSYVSSGRRSLLERLWTSPIHSMMFEDWSKVVPADIWEAVCKVVVLSIIYGVLAYVLYRKRPAEACGKTMAFPQTKQIIKVFLLFVIGIGVTLLFSTYGRDNLFLPVFGLVLGVILAHCLVEVIYELDLRAVFHQKRWCGLTLLLVGIFFCIFRFDLFAYDTYVPKAEKVESVALLTNSAGIEAYEEQGGQLQRVEMSTYRRNHMYLTNVEDICALAQKGMGKTGEDWEGKKTTWLTVLYRMKSGREVSRSFAVAYEEPETRELLDRVFGSMEFKEATYQVYSPIITDQISQLDVRYTDTVHNNTIPKQDRERLLQYYQEDLKQVNFSTELEEIICGELNILNPEMENWSWQFPVYPSFTKTIAYLKETGIWQENLLNVEDVLSIEVQWNRTEPSKQDGRVNVSAAWTEDNYVFYEQEDIKEIINDMYPREWNKYTTLRNYENEYYYIRVTMKESKVLDVQDGNTVESRWFVFEKDQIPDCVRRRQNNQ